MEALQKKFETELNKFQQIQKDMNKHISQRQTLESQLTENKFVKEEFDLLNNDDSIYKLIGPVLVKQELTEAVQTVDKRISYIQGELKRHETAIKELDESQEKMKDSLGKLQAQIQQAKLKMAVKS